MMSNCAYSLDPHQINVIIRCRGCVAQSVEVPVWCNSADMSLNPERDHLFASYYAAAEKLGAIVDKRKIPSHAICVKIAKLRAQFGSKNYFKIGSWMSFSKVCNFLQRVVLFQANA